MTTGAVLLIAGASYAGVQLAVSARAAGFAGKIMLIGAEKHLPYQRPPLSKGLMTGKSTPDSLQLKSPAFFEEERIDLLLGRTVTEVVPEDKQIRLDDGTALSYDWFAIATGARCRTLDVPGSDASGVFYLRSLDDALAIRSAMQTVRRVCVIGGGFIGLELAAALTSQGAAVTVVEAQPRLLSRALPQILADCIARLHVTNNVGIVYGAGVARLDTDNGRVTAVVLSDGREIACEMVIVGIGVVPNEDIALQAGIVCDNGIVVDGLGQTSAPGVLAIGDVATFPNPYGAVPAQTLRLESIQGCNDLARAAASHIIGQPQPYSAVPWFWSDQFDVKLQMAGLPAPTDEAVVRGDIGEGKFTVFYVRQGRVVAAHSVNKPADHMLAKKIIGAHVAATAAQLADMSFELKSLLIAQ